MRQVQCSWVPGTFDRVRLACPREQEFVEVSSVEIASVEIASVETTIERVERVLGQGSLHDLYLTGRVTLSVEEEVYQTLYKNPVG